MTRNAIIQPTPMPYQELTIPYLRDREYTSRLGEQTPYSSGSNYRSYTTNYDSDGLSINGLLTIPTTEIPSGGYPAIVFVHGYIPPAQYATTEKYVEYVDYLARNGFVVFKIDLRGHGNSEGEAGGGYYGSDYVIDTLNARAALQGSDFVNPEKVGLWGHSMAGNATLRAMAAQPDIPATAIWAGAVYSYLDQQKYGIQDNSYSPPANNVQRQNRRRDLYEKVGTPSAQSAFWRQVAPIYYLNDLKGAVGLFHAENDDVVDIGYSRDLATELSKTSVPHILNEYPSGGHNIDGSNFTSALQDTIEFYNKYLK
jgi:dipeptidyl aminopeptidase/acylaminoacyl peptidase